MTFFPASARNNRSQLLGLSRLSRMCVGGSVCPILFTFLTSILCLYRAFGPKIVPPQPILKALPKIFGHSDKSVRSDVCGASISILCIINGHRNRVLCLHKRSIYG